MKENIDIRLITKSELEQVNPMLSARFGTCNKIASGSYYERDGKKICNIALDDSLGTYKSTDMIKQIGQYVKEIWKVDEVYSFATRLA